ncbi:MAG: formylmethanofuran dehydrogenase subunit E family protein [Proteobacteria bacterium]|nr:formylmethanofuran dehydrogenase subunit E family protein [Pseudomonadota bacterium]
MTAHTTTPSEPEFFAALALLHGHRCPMSILGARLGLAARSALDAPAGQRLSALYRHQTCALDGIQLATHCTLGNGNLRVEHRGEHRLLLWVEGQSTGSESRLTLAALERGRSFAELRDRVAGLTAGAPDRRQAEATMAQLLRSLESAPEAELVAVRTGVPVEA